MLTLEVFVGESKQFLEEKRFARLIEIQLNRHGWYILKEPKVLT